MNIVPSGKVLDFEYSAYDGNGSLYVSMRIYDLSSGTATLVTSVQMNHVFNGTYWAQYTFASTSSGKNFLLQKSVYTDATFTVLNTNYSPGSEIVQVDGFDENFGRTS